MGNKTVSDVRRIRYYRSEDLNQPLEDWDLVADRPLFEDTYSDNRPNETGKTHYYCARYVFANGALGTPSKIKECHPSDPIAAAKTAS